MAQNQPANVLTGPELLAIIQLLQQQGLRVAPAEDSAATAQNALIASVVAVMQGLGIAGNGPTPATASTAAPSAVPATNPAPAGGASAGGATVGANDGAADRQFPVFPVTIKSPWAALTSQATVSGAAEVAVGGAGGTTVVPAAATAVIADAFAPPAAVAIPAAPVPGPSSSGPEDDEEPAGHGPGDANGFVCTNCHHYNMIRSAKDTWYAVTAGREVGVIQDWLIVKPLVSGVPHAVYRKCHSRAAAELAFQEAVDAGVVVVLT